MTEQIVFFDTETSDFKDPHLVQIAAGVLDFETKKITQSIDLIIKPKGWVISEEAIAIHGITNEHAHDVGISEYDAVRIFLSLAEGRKRVAYNTPFDKRIIKIATERHCCDDDVVEWENGDFECAMKKAKEVIGKKVKLKEAYHFFTRKNLENAHSAMPDMLACKAVYLAAINY